MFYSLVPDAFAGKIHHNPQINTDRLVFVVKVVSEIFNTYDELEHYRPLDLKGRFSVQNYSVL